VTPRLELVLGSTGIGKTRLSVHTALAQRAPVIALDRIQCHPEIAIGSGRPSSGELAGTRRVYLDSRPLAAGVIEAGPAVDRLVSLQRRLLDGGATTLVVEGGSISLLHELLSRGDWRQAVAVRVAVCVEGSARRYEQGVASRVEQMLGYGEDPAARTLQDELADLWDDPLARKAAAEIIGYREAIAVCDRHGLLPQEMTGRTGRLWRYELAHLIQAAHLAYAGQQRAALAEALPALEYLAEEVTLCEM